MPDQADGVSSEQSSLAFVREHLVSLAAFMASFGALCTAFTVIVFGWDAREIAIGGAVGTIIWGASNFFLERRKQLPGAEVPDAPEGMEIRVTARDGLRTAGWMLLLIPLGFGLAWFVDQSDLGAFFIPGQFAGYAAAALITAWMVRRWEVRHDKRLLVATDEDGDETLCARPC